MQLLHKIGRTYNDMNPHSVMVSGPSHDVTLVDFGFASKYTDDTQVSNHIKESKKNKVFQGNILFASLDQMSFFETTRRDDIIALFYMMIHCMCNNEFPG